MKLCSPTTPSHIPINPSLTRSFEPCPTNLPMKLGKKWMDYQGLYNWNGLLDPLDHNLRSEILRYGHFVHAAYDSFDFDSSSPTFASCKFPKTTLLPRSGFPDTGYCLTKNLRATSGIHLPRWVTEKAPSWLSVRSSWIGYVAVCQDKKEISRLGRRDVVIAYRGTATFLEWLENLRATLTHFPGRLSRDGSGPMVEKGFLSLYTSGRLSLQTMVRQEISRLLETYAEEPLSLTITGHSLGAALAVLTAYDIKTTFKRSPMVTAISFGGPRVGNRSFRLNLEKEGSRVLRIVNEEDVITKVPGFVVDDLGTAGGLQEWIERLAYAEVGKELRLRSKDCPYIKRRDIARCHDLKTYLHLVQGFASST